VGATGIEEEKEEEPIFINFLLQCATVEYRMKEGRVPCHTKK
jgi:hypothetical protein